MPTPAGTPAQLGAASTDLPGDHTEGLPGDEGHGLGSEGSYRYHTKVAAVQTAGHGAGEKDVPWLEYNTSPQPGQGLAVGILKQRAVPLPRVRTLHVQSGEAATSPLGAAAEDGL